LTLDVPPEVPTVDSDSDSTLTTVSPPLDIIAVRT
jgi:hypothetical protein